MAQTFINVQDYVALDNVYIIEKPAMLEDMVLFQSLCKFYVLAFITIGTSSGLLDYFLFIYFISLFIYLFIFIYVFIYLFVYLFIYLFIV